MPRTVRDARLDTRAARERLPRERYHWRTVAVGIALGYRRGKAGYGTWTVRVLADRATGRYETARLGDADDTLDVGVRETLTYFQAAEKARALVAERRTAEAPQRALYTVADAARDYLEWFRLHRKSHASTKTVIDAHILPRFGPRIVADLAVEELNRWHRALADTPARIRTAREASGQKFQPASDDPEIVRRRKASANRILNVLRALLNRAWREDRVASNTAWAKVKPFPLATRPVERYLQLEEARRLVNACPADLKHLVRAALLTGCRYAELAALRAEDYRPDAQAVYIREAKSGKPRHVPLNAEGVAFFEELTAGRPGGETMLVRANGRAWKKNDQVRPLTDACVAAKIDPPITFHMLRHTYGATLANRGVPMAVIAEALGHADERITRKHYGHLAPSYVAQVIRENLPTIVKAPAKVRRLAARG